MPCRGEPIQQACSSTSMLDARGGKVLKCAAVESLHVAGADVRGVRIHTVSRRAAEYFDFVAKHPQATPWLAMGQNVQFVLAGTVYEICE